ncbi:hypothetical protein ACI3L1_06705 [Deinococcus sp. SM5_A1]|uniref:hypothetical protein n=1 Tax=Deinococcus sp. SM5_A1 TaxID=3379094 RepID=UPI00385D357F
MRALILDIHARLVAALPAGTPVLLPEERETPLAGRKPGQAGGLSGYLAAHPSGYVQIEEPLSITSDGVTGVFWVPIASLAPETATCFELAQLVGRALCGFPYDPGPHREVTPAQPTLLQPGVYICRPTYDALTIDGTHTGAVQE